MQDIPVLLDSTRYLFISVTIGPPDLHHPSPAVHFKTFQVLLIHLPTYPIFRNHAKAKFQIYHSTSFFLKFEATLQFNIISKSSIIYEYVNSYDKSQLITSFSRTVTNRTQFSPTKLKNLILNPELSS